MKRKNLDPEITNTIETLGTVPRYVLQHNAISRSAQKFSAEAMKVAAMAMSLVPKDLSSRTASFTFADFCKALGIQRGGESFRVFKSAIEECMDKHIGIESVNEKTKKKTWDYYQWFSTARIEEETGVVTMTFSNELAATILELNEVYSKINLKDFGALQSKHALRLFEIGISYMSMQGKGGNARDEWYFERSIPDLRLMFGIPDKKYKMTKDFRKNVIEEPINEINEAKIGVEIKATNIKDERDKRSIGSIRFDCKEIRRPEETTKGKGRKKKNDNSQEKLLSPEKEKYLEERIERAIEAYPEKYKELQEKELRKKRYLSGTNEIMLQAIRMIVGKMLLEMYGDPEQEAVNDPHKELSACPV